MNSVQKYDLKKCIEGIKVICSNIEELNLWHINPKMSMYECLQNELIRFLAFLTSSHGYITDDTLVVLEIITGKECTADKFWKIIEELGPFSENYINEIPVIITNTVYADKNMKSIIGKKGKNAFVMRDAFGIIGNSVMGDMDNYTFLLYKNFLLNIKNYIEYLLGEKEK